MPAEQPDILVVRAVVVAMLRRHRFRETRNAGVFTRGHRRRHRVVARVDVDAELVEVSSRRATEQVGLRQPVEVIEAVVASVLKA